MTSRHSSSVVSSTRHHRLRDAGVVHQDVELAEALLHLGEQRRHGVWIAHIADHRHDLRRLLCAPTDLLMRAALFASVDSIASGDDHAATFGGQGARDGVADAAAAAGHDGNFAEQAQPLPGCGRVWDFGLRLDCVFFAAIG